MTLEREIKRLLTKEDYARLLSHPELLPFPVRHQLQINYYYETDDQGLHEHGITVRVRQKEAALTLEVKYPARGAGESAGYRIKQELSRPVDALPLRFELEREFPELGIRGEAHLTLPLITERSSFRISGGTRVELDRSSYLGITDYELEIEFEEGEAEEAFRMYKRLLPDSEAGDSTSDGKNTRFFRQYRQLMRER
ncbi:CYTH domain-containing protein [Paenibacillus puerhi]|uniref:CYTH domain-containing protein n=1 Tax=Paenibacillus puerhi TaxID=2692622 RepID=UPI0013590A5F|nr:CYTH domain-containing protein [Paenibacillus puerhi]